MLHRTSAVVLAAGIALSLSGSATALAVAGHESAPHAHAHASRVTLIGSGHAGHGQATMTLGSIAIGKLSFRATRTGAVPTKHVKGHFTAKVQDIPVALAGPITCLDVKGNRAGFLYPVTAAKPAALKGTEILISVKVGKGSAPSQIGFAGPVPKGTFHSCAPGLTPLTFKGTLKITHSK